MSISITTVWYRPSSDGSVSVYLYACLTVSLSLIHSFDSFSYGRLMLTVHFNLQIQNKLTKIIHYNEHTNYYILAQVFIRQVCACINLSVCLTVCLSLSVCARMYVCTCTYLSIPPSRVCWWMHIAKSKLYLPMKLFCK